MWKKHCSVLDPKSFPFYSVLKNVTWFWLFCTTTKRRVVMLLFRKRLHVPDYCLLYMVALLEEQRKLRGFGRLDFFFKLFFCSIPVIALLKSKTGRWHWARDFSDAIKHKNDSNILQLSCTRTLILVLFKKSCTSNLFVFRSNIYFKTCILQNHSANSWKPKQIVKAEQFSALLSNPVFPADLLHNLNFHAPYWSSALAPLTLDSTSRIPCLTKQN